MLTSNKLRIEPDIDSRTVEYRIEDGFVERRTVEPIGERSAAPETWQRLTSEELTFHVMEETILARWLSHRMGFRWLIRACNQQSSAASCESSEPSDQIAA